MSTYNVMVYGKDGKTAIVEVDAYTAEFKWVDIESNPDDLTPEQLRKFKRLQALEALYHD